MQNTYVSYIHSYIHKYMYTYIHTYIHIQGHMTLVEMVPPSAHEPGSGLSLPEPTRWNPTGKDNFDALLEREAAHPFRVLVSHAPASWLPFVGQGGPGKLVYVTRNPRDVVVSNYFFMGTPKDGWDGSMNRFLASNERTPNAFGSWFAHVAEFEALVDHLVNIYYIHIHRYILNIYYIYVCVLTYIFLLYR